MKIYIFFFIFPFIFSNLDLNLNRTNIKKHFNDFLSVVLRKLGVEDEKLINAYRMIQLSKNFFMN